MGNRKNFFNLNRQLFYMLIRKLLVLVTLMSCCCVVFAQSGRDEIELTGVEGLKVFTPHQFTIQGKIYGGDIAYHFNTSTDSVKFIKLLHIKSIDIVGGYRNLSNLTLNNDPLSWGSLGDDYSLTGRLEVQLFKAGPAALLFTPGFGLDYSTESYYTNQNPVIGSRLNLNIVAGLRLFTAITPATGVELGFDVSHFSDGAVRVPNNGINSVNVNFGLVQRINYKALSAPVHPFEYNYKSAFEIAIDAGERGVFHTKDELYQSGLNLGYSYGLNTVIRLKAGFDAGYYFTTYNNLDKFGTYEGLSTSYDKISLGMSAGADINLGRLTFMASYGYYLHFKSYNDIHTYWMPGFKYYLLPWLALQGKVYIHNVEADYVGVGLAFRIHS